MARRGAPPRLLVGYDGSPASREAVEVAARRAGIEGTVWVVHAYPSPPQLYDAIDRTRWHAEHRRRAQSLLDILVARDADLLRTRYETELAQGPTAAALMSEAREHDVDEIVVGTRGLGRIRALLGSVAHELLAIADRPVLVIPAGALTASAPSASAPDAGQTAGTRR